MAVRVSVDNFVRAETDCASFDRTREALLSLASDLTAFDRTFGTKDEVDPVRHLIGTAAGWGGLPTHEATYIGVTPDLPVVHASRVGNRSSRVDRVAVGA